VSSLISYATFSLQHERIQPKPGNWRLQLEYSLANVSREGHLARSTSTRYNLGRTAVKSKEMVNKNQGTDLQSTGNPFAC
jgi:hypothetical protein